MTRPLLFNIGWNAPPYYDRQNKKKMKQPTIKHNCKKCADFSKLYANDSKRFADKSKLYADMCQCKKESEEEKP